MMKVMSILGIVALVALLPLPTQAEWMQINVDVQPSTGVLYGPEWNAFHPDMPSGAHQGPGSLLLENMDDADGNETTVDLEFFGEPGGYRASGTSDLRRDFMIVNNNTPKIYAFELTGLDPLYEYDLTFIHAEKQNRLLDCTADLDGDGLLDDETPVTIYSIPGSSYYEGPGDAPIEATVTFVPDSTGKLIGTIAMNAEYNLIEGDFAGLRLARGELIPEPSTMVLLLSALVACFAWRRR